jgi:nucleotide-binding universal stress UspA family protein
MSNEQPILIAFDGSADAQAAVAQVAEQLPGASAIVLAVWEPRLVQALRLTWSGTVLVPNDVEDEDRDAEKFAKELAEQGAQLADLAGLKATPRWAADTHTVWEEILAVAAAEDVRMIVTGTRGLHGVRAALGSVSSRIVHHATVPVLVVPSAQTNAARAEA